MVFSNTKLKSTIKLLLISLLIGFTGGIVGMLFSFFISEITTFRMQNGWLICLLPIVSLLIVLTYKIFAVSGVGTNDVLNSADSDSKLSPLITPAVFIASVISHLLGASVGREGAALQLGGGIAVTFSKILKLEEPEKQILVRAGMAAVFSAVFGTPFTAFLFALEVVCVGSIHISSILPCLVASFSAFGVSHFLGGRAERFSLKTLSDFSLDIVWKLLILTVLCAVVGFIFSNALHLSEKYFKRFFKNEFLRISVGGVAILVLTIIIGHQTYNGAGINIIVEIFENGHFIPAAFLLKIVFTCISVGSGFKGGEIVPTLYIGATFGALIASLLGLPIVFGAALGMILLFCAVTNCPLASLFLGAELFSFSNFWYLLPCVLVCFLISGKTGLYKAQKRKTLRELLNKISINFAQNHIL